jgi:hypothetical protein
MDIQTISIIVAAAGVFIAAINSIRSSRRAEGQRQLTLETQQQALETRQAQLFMQVYNRDNTKAFQKIYEATRFLHDLSSPQAIVEKHHPIGGKAENLDSFADINSMTTFFEGIGVLAS